jgi:hypothetical protein
MGYSGARGTLIYEKNLISKISFQTPFNLYFHTFTKNVHIYYTLYSAALMTANAVSQSVCETYRAVMVTNLRFTPIEI